MADEPRRGRGRPPGAKNKPKDEAAAGIGHNGGRLSEEDEMNLLFINVGLVSNAQAKLATANSEVRNAYKRAKADGFSKKQVDLAIRLRTEEGQKSFKADLEDSARIARWSGMAIGEQGSLFDEKDRTPIAERAYDEGRRAGLQSEDLNSNPYDVTTEAGQAYISGWHDGQSKYRAGIKKKEEPGSEELIKTETPRTAPDEAFGDAIESEAGDPSDADEDEDQADKTADRSFTEELRDVTEKGEEMTRRGESDPE